MSTPLICNWGWESLPSIDMVAGDSEDFLFHTYFYTNGKPFNLESCTAEFAITSHTNRNGTPYVVRAMEIGGGTDLNEDGEVIPNNLRVVLNAEDTLNLEGKFVYQITIKDISGSNESFRGSFIIHSNINKAFLS